MFKNFVIVLTFLPFYTLTNYSINRKPEPQNTVALLGKEVVLRCHRHFDQPKHVIWLFYDIEMTWQEHGRAIVSIDGYIRPKFYDILSLNRSIDGRQNDLVIRHVRFEDAGIYECVKTQTDRSSAHLTVLQDHPVCGVQPATGDNDLDNVNDGVRLRLSCMTHLVGHCQPIMEWKLDDGSETSFETWITKYIRNAESNIESIVNPYAGSNGLVFSAKMTCPTKDFHFNNLAVNNPEYMYTWRSDSIIMFGRAVPVTKTIRLSEWVTPGDTAIPDAFFSLTTKEPVYLGDSAVFSCFSRFSNVDFYYFKDARFESKIKLTTGQTELHSIHEKHYKINKEHGFYNLTVVEASLDDNGNYTCEWDIGNKTVELIVIGEFFSLTTKDAVYSGDSPVFSCFSRNRNVDFYFEDARYKTKIKLTESQTALYPIYKRRYKIDKEYGVYNLTVVNASLADNGNYTCERNIGNQTVELIVNGNDPTCRTNISLTNVLVENDCDIDPDYIRFNCSIAYRGKVAPGMQLQMSTIGVLENVTVRSWSHSGVNYHSVQWVSKARRQMAGGQFRCEVRNTMANIHLSCSSEMVSVMYFYKSNRTQKITYNKDNQDQRSITCAANSSEQCSYSWLKPHLDYSNDIVFEGPSLDLVGRNVDLHPIHCRAECKLRGISCVDEPLIIEFSPDKEQDYMIYILVFGILLAFVFGGVIISAVVFRAYKWIVNRTLN